MGGHAVTCVLGQARELLSGSFEHERIGLDGVKVFDFRPVVEIKVEAGATADFEDVASRGSSNETPELLTLLAFDLRQQVVSHGKPAVTRFLFRP